MCLFYYERRSTAFPQLERSDINLHYENLSLCFSFFFAVLLYPRRSFPPASSLVYVEISKIRKYLLGKKKKDQKIYLLLSPRRLFLHAFIGFASVGNREKKNVRNPELELWQISFNASEAVLHNFKDNYKQKCFSHGREEFVSAQQSELETDLSHLVCLLF